MTAYAQFTRHATFCAAAYAAIFGGLGAVLASLTDSPLALPAIGGALIGALVSMYQSARLMRDELVQVSKTLGHAIARQSALHCRAADAAGEPIADRWPQVFRDSVTDAGEHLKGQVFFTIDLAVELGLDDSR